MDLSDFQLTETMNDIDMLRNFSNNHYQRQDSDYSFQQNMQLLFHNNSSSPQVGSSSFLNYQKNASPDYHSSSQPDCYSQEDIITPLISPVMTPHFDYPIASQTNKPMGFTNDLNFSPLSSPAMPPQTDRAQKLLSAHQIREQYDQLEHAKRLINQQLSEMQHQPRSPLGTPSPPVAKKMKPATPASLMSLSRARHHRRPGKVLKKKREVIDKSSPRALKPLLISPTLRPGPYQAEGEDAEHILATRSNYQNLMEGKGPALGIAFKSQIKSGLEVRRTAHKAAEQKRRDSLKEWFDKLRYEVEEGYVKRQTSLMSQVIQAQKLEGSGSENDTANNTIKPLSKVLLLQYAYEYIDSLKTQLAQKEEIIHTLSEHSD
ncbi:hypothetical protein BY458DRAFT_492041 [Sporodiniella umbellata]|nr:hypothetical protein BY458DRAFT_492041 [Sporodiniella umbellata]